MSLGHEIDGLYDMGMHTWACHKHASYALHGFNLHDSQS